MDGFDAKKKKSKNILNYEKEKLINDHFLLASISHTSKNIVISNRYLMSHIISEITVKYYNVYIIIASELLQ